MTLPDIPLISSSGEGYNLNDYADNVLLIVNTATGCGLNDQFKGLEELYQDYKSKNFTVLGFPTNQFKQETQSNEDMAATCEMQFGVTFPLNEIIDVNGESAHPLYQWVKSQQQGMLSDAIKWNFTKFLIDKDGRVVKRYSPTTTPEKLRKDIEKLL